MAEHKTCSVRECAVTLAKHRYVPADAAGWGAMHEYNELEILVAFDSADMDAVAALDKDGNFLAYLKAEQLAKFAPWDPATQAQIAESMAVRRQLEKGNRETIALVTRAARANGAKSPLEAMADRLQLGAGETGRDIVTQRNPSLSPHQRQRITRTAGDTGAGCTAIYGEAQQMTIAHGNPGLGLDQTDSAERVRRLAQSYINRSGMSVVDFARRIGYGYPTLRFFLAGNGRGGISLAKVAGAILDFIEQFPIDADAYTGNIYETGAVRMMRRAFSKSMARPQVMLIYAPPGSGKTEIARHLIAEHNAQRASAEAAKAPEQKHHLPRLLPRAHLAARPAAPRGRCLRHRDGYLDRQGHPQPALGLQRRARRPLL